jgi:lysophospholipase L1-like esterase
VSVLGLLLVPLTAALTAAEDAPAVAALAAGALSPMDSAALSPLDSAVASAPQDVTTPSPTAPAVRRVVGLGDSVPAGSACGCNDYVSLLASGLGAKVTSTNLAVPGQTSSGLIDQLSSPQVRAALADADVVVVTIGANDVEATDPSDCTSSDDGPQCYADDLATLEGNLDHIAAAVTAAASKPGARVLLTGYWNVFLDGSTARARGAGYVQISDAVTRVVNAGIRSAAAKHGGVYVDLFTPFRGADGSKDCTALLAADGDHPDAAGHALIARTLLAAL